MTTVSNQPIISNKMIVFALPRYDIVSIETKEETVKELQKDHGGWRSGMDSASQSL